MLPSSLSSRVRSCVVLTLSAGVLMLSAPSRADIPAHVLAASQSDKQQPEQQLPLMTGAVYQADYILDAGDQVLIEDVTMGKIGEKNKILSDGSLQLPLVGKVYAGGMSISELTDELNRLYKKYYVNPNFTVQIGVQRPTRLYVSGAVKSPGVFVSGENLRPQPGGTNPGGADSSENKFYRVFLTDALMMAGGLKYNANATDIRIVRQFPKPMTLHVNLMDLLTNNNTNQDVALRDKDIIEVPEVPKETVVMDAQWTNLMNTNVTLGVYKVNILGAVKTPGTYEVMANDSILKLVSDAGGFAENANTKQVFILRANSAGQVFKKQINLSDHLLKSKKPYQQTAMLLPEDVVFVDESGAKAVRKFASNTATQMVQASTFAIMSRLFGFIDTTGD